MITWEEDYPTKYVDNKLPVLDVKMYVDVDDDEEPIKYEFYQKDVANKKLVSALSAMPRAMKFSTLVEELCR